MRNIFFFIFLFSFFVYTEKVFSQGRPYRYTVELTSGQTISATWMHYDSLHGSYEATVCDACDSGKRKMILIYPDVKRILSVSDPIRPPKIYEWKTSPDPPDTLRDPVKPPDCDCMGYDRLSASYFLDARLGLNLKGKNSYTFSTATGPQTVTSTFFSPSNIGSTNLTFEAEVAAGWIVGRFDLGLMIGLIPTDGFVYFPAGIHGRYYLGDDCCSFTIFADAGLPLDFATHAPVFISPLTSDRQRRFFDIGVGKIWPFSESMRFAVDLGYRYLVIPLAEIQCCPTITGDNRFPARKSHELFLQAGFSF